MKTKKTNSKEPAHPVWAVGNQVFIRTVTHYLTGRVSHVYPTEIVLIDAAWVADTGRFHKAMADEKFTEVEPFPDGRPVVVNRGSIVDATLVTKPQREVA